MALARILLNRVVSALALSTFQHSLSFLTSEVLLVIWRTLKARVGVSQAQPPLGGQVASSHQSGLSSLSALNQGFLWKGGAL